MKSMINGKNTTVDMAEERDDNFERRKRENKTNGEFNQMLNTEHKVEHRDHKSDVDGRAFWIKWRLGQPPAAEHVRRLSQRPRAGLPPPKKKIKETIRLLPYRSDSQVISYG
ncbi:hypothetical protein T265_02048 [Opisthorchis viverrini]|uniref:Uncharacterized protein n=1 Tax=Opisthorchis viverrini TaxID=6198 RepID=A0A074ZXJ9_OPIVI|nr:hypothetical protein T265_02048 [Opisthorchis viverrini]KER31821.1 hypothetical protein T265_02048 [Opisthorchis viverrini]